MFRWRNLAWLFLAASLILAPALAEARAGGSYRIGGGGGSFSSFGSRGSQTFTGNGAQPLARTTTPQSTPGYSPYAAAPGAGYGGGFLGAHPFLSGIAGGFFGSWIGGMLFPHFGGYGGGYGGGGGFFGSIFVWMIVIGVIWMVIRRFGFGRSLHASPSTLSPLYQDTAMQPGYGAAAAAPALDAAPLGIVQADYQAFEQILIAVQTAWGKTDLAALRRYVTPEMAAYFSEQLAENQSQGVINHIEGVELVKGDVRQSWDEGHLHYASTELHWRAIDYTARVDREPGAPDYIVEGDTQRPSDAGEMWTFARSPGGQWLLAAIQQL